MRLFGGLFVELNDLDSAEKLYKALAARDPTKSYGFAMFLGQHRSVDQCFELLNQIYQPDRIADILGVALTVVRENAIRSAINTMRPFKVGWTVASWTIPTRSRC